MSSSARVLWSRRRRSAATIISGTTKSLANSPSSRTTSAYLTVPFFLRTQSFRASASLLADRRVLSAKFPRAGTRRSSCARYTRQWGTTRIPPRHKHMPIGLRSSGGQPGEAGKFRPSLYSILPQGGAPEATPTLADERAAHLQTLRNISLPSEFRHRNRRQRGSH